MFVNFVNKSSEFYKPVFLETSFYFSFPNMDAPAIDQYLNLQNKFLVSIKECKKQKWFGLSFQP